MFSDISDINMHLYSLAGKKKKKVLLQAKRNAHAENVVAVHFSRCIIGIQLFCKDRFCQLTPIASKSTLTVGNQTLAIVDCLLR